LDVLFLEIINAGLEIGQLPIAVWSPAAAVEDENRILACKILRKMKRMAIHGSDFILGKRITNI
ncbi:MAG TPA: hypothetical protein VGA99_03460, partial [bacterium]